MKKTLLLLAVLFTIGGDLAKATTHIVTVANFSFTPSILNVNTGDTITWVWSSGSHTTTSTNVPAGADPWDSDINSNITSFSYVPSVAGTYNYVCQPHSGSMQGTIVVTSGVGISETAPVKPSLNGVVRNGELQLSLYLLQGGSGKIQLMDMEGKIVRNLHTGSISAGNTSFNFPLTGIANGVYLANIEMDNLLLTKRIAVQ